MRNADMAPGDRLSQLKKTWENKKLLVIEEISMVPPVYLNMLLYRSFHARRDTYEVDEAEYDKHRGAFGRMAIVLKLGDFCQLKPTANASLMDDPNESERDIPPEWQMAAKYFMDTHEIFELRETKRFKDARLAKLISFMRNPTGKIPADVAEYWEAIQYKPGDTRLQEDRFQDGHMLAIYWETVARWVTMRARRDAESLETPVFVLQAADSSEGLTLDLAAKLLNRPSPYETGHMHGIFLVHLGMHVRLLVPLCKDKGLVQEAEGVVVSIAVNPKDQDLYDAAFTGDAWKEPVYLTELPFGLWVRFEKYCGAPFKHALLDIAPNLPEQLVDQLVFVEPCTTQRPFHWRGFHITRRGFPLTHGRVRTATACQGKTLHGGVLIDCGRRTTGKWPMDDDDWWVNLYVMLSRATRLDDLVLLRAPDIKFLERGPPKNLLRMMKRFEKHLKRGRDEACQYKPQCQQQQKTRERQRNNSRDHR